MQATWFKAILRFSCWGRVPTAVFSVRAGLQLGERTAYWTISMHLRTKCSDKTNWDRQISIILTVGRQEKNRSLKRQLSTTTKLSNWVRFTSRQFSTEDSLMIRSTRLRRPSETISRLWPSSLTMHFAIITLALVLIRKVILRKLYNNIYIGEKLQQGHQYRFN